MCRIPKVVLIAPDDVRNDLRRKLSSLEYDITAVVGAVEDAAGVTADVAVLYEPDTEMLAAARALGLKTVALGGTNGADLHLEASDAASFKTRIWELFRPS